MNKRDWFFVGVRLFGLWVLLDAITEARFLIEVVFSLVQLQRTALGVYLLHFGVDLVVGFYLLAGAPGLGGFVFPRQDPAACPACGYNLTANTSGVCPECGAAVAKPPERAA